MSGSDDGSAARVVVVGLGPAGPGLTTVAAAEQLARAEHRRLRTSRHPAAAPLTTGTAPVPSYDDLYETAPTFDAVYDGICADLVDVAQRHGEVTYAVPGSPFVLERTVAQLLLDDRVAVSVIPGMSFLDLAYAHIGIDPVESGLTLVDGHRFAVDAAGATGALLVGHCHANSVLSDIKLAYDEIEPDGAIILQRLGLADEHVVEVSWADLDRAVEADHLTSVFIPAVGAPVANELIRFQQLVRDLRQGCPWDREQTHDSLTRYLIEETYEVIEAIDGYDPATGAGADHLIEELGDLLFQVYFHATIAAESGAFTLADVARTIHDKLHRRHPHVFGDVTAADADAVARNWEQIKREEKGRDSVMDGIPTALPGLLYAHKVLSKAERLGLVGPEPVEPDGDLGTALLALVAYARHAGLDAETAIRRAADAVRAAAIARENPSTPTS